MAFWGSTDEADWTSDAYGIGYDPTTTSVTLEAGATLWSISTGSQISDGLWHHIAVVRNSGTWQVFIDGVSKGTTTSQGTRTLGNSTYRNALGSVEPGAGDGRFVRGFMSNCRIGNTAVYTSNFTPSTTPLTAISGTQLLTCQSNRFIDNSANNFTFTKVGAGTPSVQRFNPFGASTAYSTSVIGGSGYFDGTGDYLSTPNSSSFAFGTGNFTVEFWYRGTSTGGGFGITTGGSSGYWQFNLFSSTLYWSNDVGVSNVLSVSATSILNNAWNHVAIVRNSTTLTLYFNGVSVASASDSSNYSGTGGDFRLGLDGNSAYIAGYIADYRIVKGTAVYTSAFTPPTAPLTAITNTSLMTNFTNGAIFDNAMMNNLETAGNAQISTSVVKYGTGSLYFDGTGDYLIGPSTPNMNFGSGDFTVEAWVYRQVTSGTTQTIYQKGRVADSNFELSFVINTSNQLEVYYSTSGTSATLVATTTASVSQNTWTHIAVTRSGSTWRVFIGGTLDVSATASVTLYTGTGRISIATNPNGDSPFTGYIDDLRVTKGYARYTATFTPPTAALPDTGPN